ncbi:type II toxin-antitoxin system VapC family toxin [Deinococcus sp. AJ005]|uniref:type II toxin-antitoxin system VapC family toxin n=1 Tax=Deinococcus sp. AJ005 TaxID=2652443 RepID=UPI00125CB138|nr:type II toxin-antitoxin system VapC family toxin [Deinococcus sp. AJ005]QFP75345.1 type II toxin-antitoxin system VapC family toxin [Deinococcus sp. AJ005]
MRILIDTNIALRFVQAGAPGHASVEHAVKTLLGRGDELMVVPQVVYELWAVGTRPKTVNGFGWTSEEARKEIDGLSEQFSMLQDTPSIFAIWLELVTQHHVSGKPTHDARLAAALIVHSLDALLTFNAPDFKRFGLNIINPTDLSEGDSTL